MVCVILAAACGRSGKPVTIETKPALAAPHGAVQRSAAPQLFDVPLSVTSSAEGVLLTESYANGEARDYVYAVAVPPGTGKFAVESVRLRNPRTGQVAEHPLDSELLSEPARRNEVNARFDMRGIGMMRRVELARIRVRARDRLATFNPPMELAGFTLRISTEGESAGKSTSPDSGFSDKSSPYRELVSRAVCNPDAIDMYAAEPVQPHPHEMGSPLVRWHADPARSQGMPWLKIPVTKEGLYMIDDSWLKAAGVDGTTIKPEELRLFSMGGPVALEPVLPGELSFADGQRLMFYARTTESTETPIRPYYLCRSLDKNLPPRFRNADAPLADLPVRDRLFRQLKLEEDYLLETRVGNFLSIRGMTWVWRTLKPGTEERFTFNLPGLVYSGENATLTVDLYYAGLMVPGDVPARVNVNGTQFDLGPIPTTNQFLDIPQLTLSIPSNLLKPANNNVGVSIQASKTNPNGMIPIFIDRINVSYAGDFAPVDGRLAFKGGDLRGARAGAQKILARNFRMYRLNAVDVTTPDEPGRLRVDVEGGDQLVTVPDLSANSHVLLLDDDGIERAPAGTAIVVRAIDTINVSADTVIITHGDFMEAAELLAADLREAGQEVVIADVGDLYEWYTAGVLGWSAVREYLREMIANPRGRRPSQAILIGDCTSDGRGVARNAVKNYIPTFSFTDPRRRQSDQFATDSMYSWLSGDDELADILVGRLSVATAGDAMKVVRKQIAYRQLRDQPWAGRALTLADYGIFEERTREMVDRGVDPSFHHRLLPSASFPWEDNYYLPPENLRDEDRKVAPLVTAEVQHAFNTGTGIISFFGHGAPNLWSNQRIWFGGDSDNSDNLLLSNVDKPAFVTSFTCNNGAIDYPMPRWNICIAEDMMRVPGGAIGVFMPSGPGFPDQHIHFAEGFMRAVTILGVRHLGVASELSRLAYQVRHGSDDHSRMYIYLGVPTLSLPAAELRARMVLSDPEGRPVANVTDAGKGVMVQLDADDAITSGVVTAATSTGYTLEERFIAVQGNRAEAEFGPLVGSTFDGDVTISADLVLASGRRATVGRRLFLPKRLLFIEDVDGLADWGEGLERRINVTLRNDAFVECEGRLRAVLADQQGNLGETFEVPYRVVGRGRGTFPVVVRAPRAGVYSLELVTSSTEPELAPSTAPPAFALRRPIIMGGVSGGFTWMARDTMLRPGYGSSGVVSWLLPVVNTSQGRIDEIETKLECEMPPGSLLGAPEFETVGPMAAGEARWLTTITRLPREIAQPFLLRLTVESAQGGGPVVSERTFSTAEIPDLEVVPGSVHVEPALLTQGSSVIVKLAVRNAGGPMGGPFRVALAADKEGQPGDPLPCMTAENDREYPPLRPGASTEIRLRWDPFAEVGRVRIWATADARGAHVESNKRNNSIPIDLDFRSKWKLRAGPIGFRPLPDRKVMLGAYVENDGETDAQRVTVLFYRNEPHTKDNLIGEVLLPRVPAKSNQTVEFIWDVSKENPEELRAVKPSYTIQLKGSLQRVSSSTQ